MPLATDIIRTTMIQELAGVQMANDIYWQVDDVGSDPTLPIGLGDVMTAYHQAVLAFVSDKWSLVCGIYENMSRVEAKITVFDNLAGTGTDDSHPQDQVFRFNRYGQDVSTNPIKRGAFSQSGVEEEWSTRGRVNNVSTFDTLRDFLRDQIVLPGPNWTLQPQQRWISAPGPPPVWTYYDVIKVAVSSRVYKLGRRKTALCATG